MRHLGIVYVCALSLLAACGNAAAPASPAAPSESAAAAGGDAAPESAPAPAPTAEGGGAEASEFAVHMSDKQKESGSAPASKIKGTHSEAALKFVVVEKDKGPLPGIVISLTGADGKKYYTEETNAEGYTEILVPIAQKYELVYLSLGRREIAASVTVTDEPNQNIKLTLRYKRFDPPHKTAAPSEPRFVLEGVTFASGKAVINPESYPRLDAVVEYMTYKKSARIEISGHTDNQGNPKTNKALSEKRAQACRQYLVGKGVDDSRIEAHGFGDERPIAPNDTEEGRQLNRRIEATEL
jgi:outer membrane protein OmpA-like peptidoglycan-associated protein